jgi:hypothetical protein
MLPTAADWSHCAWAAPKGTTVSFVPWNMIDGGRPAVGAANVSPASATAPAAGVVAGPRDPGR